MVLHRGILPQIIQRLYVTMKSAAKLFWTEYPQADGVLRKILQVLQYFFHLQPVIMLTVQFLLLTADGWDVNFIPQSAIIKSEICIETLVTNTIFLMTIIKKLTTIKTLQPCKLDLRAVPVRSKRWTLRLYAGNSGGKPYD